MAIRSNCYLAAVLCFALASPLALFAQTPVQTPAPPPDQGGTMMTRNASGSAAPITPPAFDVISIKVHKGDSLGSRMRMNADGFSAENVNVHTLLLEGYGINEEQISGEPDWTRTAYFDIDAKVAGPDVATLSKLPPDQRRAMFLQVLTDRFHLTLHHELHPLPVYNLVVDKGGPKMPVSERTQREACGSSRRTLWGDRGRGG